MYYSLFPKIVEFFVTFFFKTSILHGRFASCEMGTGRSCPNVWDSFKDVENQSPLNISKLNIKMIFWTLYRVNKLQQFCPLPDPFLLKH